MTKTLSKISPMEAEYHASVRGLDMESYIAGAGMSSIKPISAHGVSFSSSQTPAERAQQVWTWIIGDNLNSREGLLLEFLTFDIDLASGKGTFTLSFDRKEWPYDYTFLVQEGRLDLKRPVIRNSSGTRGERHAPEVVSEMHILIRKKVKERLRQAGMHIAKAVLGSYDQKQKAVAESEAARRELREKQDEIEKVMNLERRTTMRSVDEGELAILLDRRMEKLCTLLKLDGDWPMEDYE